MVFCWGKGLEKGVLCFDRVRVSVSVVSLVGVALRVRDRDWVEVKELRVVWCFVRVSVSIMLCSFWLR